ncbi:MAG: hypothetical protein AAGC60_08170 [Acidobacteriota bacterium]
MFDCRRTFGSVAVLGLLLGLALIPSGSADAIQHGCFDCWQISYDFALCRLDQSGIGGFSVCWVDRDCDFDICFETCYVMFACMWA